MSATEPDPPGTAASKDVGGGEASARPAEELNGRGVGGEPPCLLPSLCEECGLVIEDRFADRCPRCGAVRG